MRILALLFGIAISACTTPGLPQAQSSAPDVAGCVAEAQPEARRACIGLVSSRCMEEPGGDTTVGMVQCAQAETRQWEAIRHRQIVALRARESESQLALLDAALTEQARWALANCSYEASRYEGGTLAQVVAATCIRDQTAELTLSLIARDDEG
ncbi:MAG: lysozyme inhibitor LprI family protein [Hyphomonadaceae bacterium]